MCDLVKRVSRKPYKDLLKATRDKALQTSTKEGRKAHVVKSSHDRARSPYRGQGYGGTHTLESNGKACRLPKE